jgi:isopentenyl-diphosphate Delta-isomerase
MEQRKSDHIRIALQSQVSPDEHDDRFHYEPLLQAHPAGDLPSFRFLGKQLRIPLWVSSMTGGTQGAGEINRNLAKACNEFGMGMGLGSCRILLNGNSYFEDFNVRDVIGDDLPLYANLGIVQVEHLVHSNRVTQIHDLVARLRADGLIIHINPLQEWFQPEGDRLNYPPIDTIRRFLNLTKYPVIVKEVGQGMGPASLKELFKLPLSAIEFAAFGGTNFARAELLRGSPERQFLYEPYTRIGEDGYDMIGYVNDVLSSQPTPLCHEVIVSGGIKNFLDGYYLISKVHTTAIYGQASGFLQHANVSYESLQKYCSDQVNGLKLAYAYLTVK